MVTVLPWGQMRGPGAHDRRTFLQWGSIKLCLDLEAFCDLGSSSTPGPAVWDSAVLLPSPFH